MKSKIIMLFIVSLFCTSGCISTNISHGDLPGEGQSIAFMGAKLNGDIYIYRVSVAQENKNVYQIDGAFNLSSKNPAEAIFLMPGRYYFTNANYANLVILLNNPKKIFKIDNNYINYIGTMVFDSDQANMVFNARLDDSMESYKIAIENFKLKFPELSRKYKFKYSLLN